MTRNRTTVQLAVLGLIAFAVGFGLPEQASARPAKCFGKKINKVVTGSGKTVRLKYRDVAWIAGDRVTVITKPDATVCSDSGRQTIRVDKGRTRVNTGADSDRIFLHSKSSPAVIYAGLGNDVVTGSRGHDRIYASPKRNPRGKPDRDRINGLGGNDRIFDYSGVGNRISGDDGVDRLYSLGNSVSSVYGGNGSDWLFSTGGRSGYRIEQLFGERGNDRLLANRAPGNGPAFLDPGPGDDWIDGTNRADTITSQSGITKIRARGGDDLILAGTKGQAKMDGGGGTDVVSFAAHAPLHGGTGGVTVNLAGGTARGMFSNAPWHYLSNIENVEGSPFNDSIQGRYGQRNVLDGGLGDDYLQGSAGDGDRADGGIGVNSCEDFAEMTNCNGKSPGRPDGGRTVVDANLGGVLTVVGSRYDDRITAGYEASRGRYRIDLDASPLASGRCEKPSPDSRTVYCRISETQLNGMVMHGGYGDDRLTVGNSVPHQVTTTLNGGTGQNVLTGGRSKDFMETAEGSSAGSVMTGRGNSDVIYVYDRVTAVTGPGSDVIMVRAVCDGSFASGGPGKDNLVFAPSRRGVDANLARGTSKWKSGGCGSPLRMKHDIEGIEGSRYNDRLTLGRRYRQQQGKHSLVGREGIDILDSRNGAKDTVTTGSGGRRNRVIADRIDKVIWGWGFAAY
ncbi:MAG: calcium-binding protein [Solirubrobacterales bacterium]|nr:calcium-binding protein [Solirubrobacterales bacterium]